MDAVAALADLTEISSQVETAVVLDDGGALLGSTPDDPVRSERLARTGLDLLGAAQRHFQEGTRALTQLEVALRSGSVFVVRDGARSIVATTGAGPTSGLVFYDLRTCLRALDDPAPPPEPKPKRTRTRKPKADA